MKSTVDINAVIEVNVKIAGRENVDLVNAAIGRRHANSCMGNGPIQKES